LDTKAKLPAPNYYETCWELVVIKLMGFFPKTIGDYEFEKPEQHLPFQQIKEQNTRHHHPFPTSLLRILKI